MNVLDSLCGKSQRLETVQMSISRTATLNNDNEWTTGTGGNVVKSWDYIIDENKQVECNTHLTLAEWNDVI